MTAHPLSSWIKQESVTTEKRILDYFLPERALHLKRDLRPETFSETEVSKSDEVIVIKGKLKIFP